MTNDPNSPMSSESGEPSPVADAMADAKAAFNKAGFATPTGMVALAGLILLGVELIFGIMLREFSIGPWLLPALLAVIVYYAKGNYDPIGPADKMLKLIGMLMAGIAVVSILNTLRSASVFFDEFADVLGYLLTWGASVLAFLGARAIK